MKLTRVRCNIALVDFVKRRLKIGAEEVPKYLNNVKVNKEVFINKVRDINNWYTRIIGLDEVRLYQDRVASLQDRLLAAQEKRREIGQHLAEVRQQSNELQEQIHKTKRQENLQRFLELMKTETEILKMEEKLSRTFAESDREEREIFTAFTNAVRDSHEKQRAQLEYTKYFGIILSIIGSLLTFCYSTVKKHELQKCIEQNIAKLGPTVPQLITLNTSENYIDELIQKSTSPIVDKIQTNEKQMAEIKKLLADKSQLAAISKELKNNRKELSYIKRLIDGSSQTSKAQESWQSFEGVGAYDVLKYGAIAVISYAILRGLTG